MCEFMLNQIVAYIILPGFGVRRGSFPLDYAPPGLGIGSWPLTVTIRLVLHCT